MMDDAMYEALVAGTKQMVAHVRGEDVPGLRVHVPRAIDVAAIRKAAGLSQRAFADTIGVAIGTLQGWEQGRRAPEGPARVLLSLLAINPKIVEEMLTKPV